MTKRQRLTVRRVRMRTNRSLEGHTELNTNALTPDCRGSGHFVCLSRVIPAFELVLEPNGQSKLGSISRLPCGALLEVCGDGFNNSTIKVRMDATYYFVFRSDLPKPECTYCDAETTVYVNGKPVCLQCEGAKEHLRNSAQAPQGQHD
jgi:hypothetical protein